VRAGCGVVASAPIVRGLVDLHCHWIAGIDDGAKSSPESAAMLRGLAALGFEHVVATPHMRPGMFDNVRDELVAAYDRTVEALQGEAGVPTPSRPSPHFFGRRRFGAPRPRLGRGAAGGRQDSTGGASRTRRAPCRAPPRCSSPRRGGSAPRWHGPVGVSSSEATDEDAPGLPAKQREVGLLGKEAIAGMDRLGAAGAGGVEDAVDAEIAV